MDMKLFDRFAARYDLWYEKPFGNSAYKLELECLKKVMPTFNRGIEIGVGTGRFATKLGVRYGLDISMNMLSIAKTRGIYCVLADAMHMPFKDGTFDLALIVVSICFFRKPEGVLMETARILRKGASLVLGLILDGTPWATYYRKEKKDHPLYMHARFYTKEEVASMLESSGFVMEAIYTTLLEEPQDDHPVRNLEIREGFHEQGGFFCIRATKL